MYHIYSIYWSFTEEYWNAVSLLEIRKSLIECVATDAVVIVWQFDEYVFGLVRYSRVPAQSIMNGVV